MVYQLWNEVELEMDELKRKPRNCESCGAAICRFCGRDVRGGQYRLRDCRRTACKEERDKVNK